MQLSNLYKPLTAHPFEQTISYWETERFHTLNIREALQYAANDVVFLQDKRDFLR